MNYKEGEVVAIPPMEKHNNTSSGGFTNIHLRIAEPSFPYRGAFRVMDYDGHLLTAFTQAKFFFLADMKKKELVLTALGELISSYMVVYRSNAEFSEPVEMIRSAIMHNYEKADFALDQAIRELPFHYDYLRKLFKKEVGVSPLEYMTSLRMKSAETLLTAMWTNEYSVSEIARMCGFEDSLYFSRVFKKYYGCSPSNFARNRNQPHCIDPGRTELTEK
jgi:AraC-like DNA-binding protein